MIVPEYWAEARLQQRSSGKQLTVRRFGWSDDSLDAAQRHAELRAQEAMDRILAGERLPRRERKVPYNGAEGLPIREEIVARHDDVVVTRNSYGALCLNTPDVLFVDIDYEEESRAVSGSGCAFVMLLAVAIAFGLWQESWAITIGGALVALVVAGIIKAIDRRKRAALPPEQTPEARAKARVDAFLQANPEWGFRRYLTPAGLRLLATHRTFSPQDPELQHCFQALSADPVYVRMCLRQNCFRARVSPKPWRIGISGHLRPQPGVWPVAPERLPERRAWVAAYEAAARGRAACRFDGEVGSRSYDRKVDDVRRLHDDLARAESELPTA